MAVTAADLGTGIIGWQGATSPSGASPVPGLVQLGALIGGGLAIAALAGNLAFSLLQAATIPALPAEHHVVQSSFTSSVRADYTSSASAPIAPQRAMTPAR